MFPGRLSDGNFTSACLGGAGTMLIFWLLRFLLPETPILHTLDPFYAGIAGTIPGLLYGLLKRGSLCLP
jgi:hypothetical protein